MRDTVLSSLACDVTPPWRFRSMEGFMTFRLFGRSGARALALGLVAWAVALLAGCGTTLPPAPTSAATPQYRYLIGPLDTVSVIVWRNPELSMAGPVRPDGRISVPLVEDIQAQGRNPTDLARDIEKALSKFIRDPVVTVMVTGFQGPYSEQIRVIGEAQRPQSVPYRQNMTLLDVMVLVGGLTDFADGNAAVLVRGAEGGKQYSVRLRDLVKRGNIAANVDVKPGDVLIIPQSWF
jgi:polysaccharide export outer membrane protein